MKRYWFTLMNEAYEDLGVLIPDGSSKATAVNRAKRWMQVNSMRTDNLLEFIEITL